MNAMIRSVRFLPAVWSLLLVGLFAPGCASRYPLGLTREQWEALPPETQADYQAKQTALEEQRRSEQEALAAERKRQSAELAQAQAALIEDRYRNAVFGDIIQVSIMGGDLYLYGKPHAYQPVTFELVRGETKPVTITRIRRSFDDRAMLTVDIDASLSSDGNVFTFNSNSYNRIVLVNQKWERGEVHAPPVPRSMSGVDVVGASFRIQYRDVDAAQRKVIDHGP